MDVIFVVAIVALYVATRWLVSAFARLGGVE
jgi:hypothetical protein